LQVNTLIVWLVTTMIQHIPSKIFCQVFSTVKYGRPSGNKTELTKIIEGWGNYLFYGFSDDTETSLRFWSLFDLGIFRLWYNRELFNLNKGEHPGTKINNHDNSSSFMVFNYKNFPKDFIIGQKSATQGCSATK